MTMKIFKWFISLLLIGLSSCFLWLSNAYAGSTLSAGLHHVCGIKADSTLECWGGDNNPQYRLIPPDGTFTQVSAGFRFNCALKTDGTLACWGHDTAGETSQAPGYYKQVEAGAYHACALDENGVPKCWGNNDSGQVEPSQPGPFQQLALGGAHSCGLKADGTVECWGNNEYGQTDMPADTTFSSITGGHQTTCGIKTDGVAICWGQTNQSYGYLTQIDFTLYLSSLCGLKVDNTPSCPSMGSEPSDKFSYVTIGHYFACGIKTDGLVDCWGDNKHGKATPPTGENGEDIVFKHEVIPVAPCSPAPCFTQADIDATYEAGRQACIANPSSCNIAISPEPEIAAFIGTDLSLHVSKMEYKSLTGTSILWADLIFGGENEQGKLMWILGDYGTVE